MPIFTALRPLVLASASPRRRAFMAELGLRALALDPDPSAEPSSPLPRESARDFALRAAAAKAADVCARVAEKLPVVIGADTVVVLDGEILGKPSGAEEALDFLSRLSGRTHEVITACAVYSLEPAKDGEPAPSASSPAFKAARPLSPASPQETFAVSTRVAMRPWPREALAAYAAGGEPLDKAGAYAIQGQGAFLVDSISGSWSNVVGLPLAELLDALLRLGAVRYGG